MPKRPLVKADDPLFTRPADPLPPEPRAEAIAALSAELRFRSGPLPEPQTLAEYERLLPGGAERIFRFAEKDQDFTHQAFFRDQRNAHVVKVLGQVFGFLLGMGGIGVAGWLIGMDRSVTGLIIFCGSLATLILAAAYGRKEPEKTPPEGNKKG